MLARCAELTTSTVWNLKPTGRGCTLRMPANSTPQARRDTTGRVVFARRSLPTNGHGRLLEATAPEARSRAKLYRTCWQFGFRRRQGLQLRQETKISQAGQCPASHCSLHKATARNPKGHDMLLRNQRCSAISTRPADILPRTSAAFSRVWGCLFAHLPQAAFTSVCQWSLSLGSL